MREEEGSERQEGTRWKKKNEETETETERDRNT